MKVKQNVKKGIAFCMCAMFLLNLLPIADVCTDGALGIVNEAEAAVTSIDSDTYNEKMNSFINDSRYKAGVACTNCYTYAEWFTQYMFGRSPRGGDSFSNPSEIRAGDILHFYHSWSSGSSQHWIVVLARNGNSLYTAEGNVSGGKVRISNNQYWIEGNQLKEKGCTITSFDCGYHHASISSSVSGEYLGTDFYAYIVNVKPWKHLANQNGNVVTYDIKGDANDIWKFDWQGDGSYIITNVANGKVLDVYGANSANGTNVQTWELNRGDSQKWCFIKSGNNYVIVSRCGGKVLNIDENSNAIIWDKHGGDNQIFSVRRLTNDMGGYLPLKSHVNSNAKVPLYSAANDNSKTQYYIYPEDNCTIKKFEGDWVYVNVPWSGGGSRDYWTKLTYFMWTRSTAITKTVASTAVYWRYDRQNQMGTIPAGTELRVVNWGNTNNDDNNLSSQVIYKTSSGWQMGWVKTSNITYYNVIFNANGGTGAPGTQVKTKNIDLTLSSTVPTRTGYTFTGWNTKADGTGTSYAKGAKYTANASVTLYAQWKSKEYTLTINPNGGTIKTEDGKTDTTKPVSYNTKLVYDKSNWWKVPVCKRLGYTLNGLYTAPSAGTKVYLANGECVNDGKYFKEKKYVYAGDLSVYAQWIPNTYTVVYNSNGATSGTTASSLHTYDTAKTLTANGFSKNGYTFTGWNTKADGTGTAYGNNQSVKNLTATNQGKVTLYAQWSINKYTISYNANGGTGAPGNQTKTYGSDLTLSSTVPTRTGYTFTGWNTKADGTGTSYAKGAKYTANASVTLYAQWKSKEYTLTINPNGGTIKTEDGKTDTTKPVSYNTKLVYDKSNWWKVPVCKRLGYTLNGLYTAPSAGTKVYLANGECVNDGKYFKEKKYVYAGDLSVYAQWIPNTYTVVYNSNGATSGTTASSLHTYDTAKTLTANGFSKNGYTFTGWNTKADGTGTAYGNNQSVKNLTATNQGTVTLYAQWKIESVYKLRVEGSTVRQGEQVAVPVYVEGTAIGSIQIKVTYDSTKLMYVGNSYSAFESTVVNDDEKGILFIAAMNEANGSTGKLFVLDFKAIADKTSETSIGVTVEESVNEQEKNVPLSVQDAVIKISSFLLGDVNGDGKITALDARWVLQAAAGKRNLGEYEQAGDVNGDGKITALDARWILQAAAGKRKLQ
ncbi:MAG: InlB B-repeat-containing protein [Lachnospiraceae bacterium]|nr:InlB B-repeat-containing protein [Lachnospiraceae bacterium]